jgi:dienelactone hydrolase
MTARTAYIARPDELPAPAVVVLQELVGVNADIRENCDELAEQGFIAIAPDLFWRQEPGADLGVRSEADWQHWTPLTPWQRCPSAPARLPYLATASGR